MQRLSEDRQTDTRVSSDWAAPSSSLELEPAAMAVQSRLLLRRAQAANVSMDPERQRDKRSFSILSDASKLFPEITLRGSEETERAASAARLENIDLLRLDSRMLTCTPNTQIPHFTGRIMEKKGDRGRKDSCPLWTLGGD